MLLWQKRQRDDETFLLSVVFSKMVGTTAVAIMLTGVMMPTDTLGAPITRGTGATAENDGGIAVGERTNARGDYGVAMGTDATVGKMIHRI